ncbi:M24 family metallopeptidase [Patescibacteria group bacterium]|nr:M24 family metallopeptidase [Patescibacteria group bacterium]
MKYQLPIIQELKAVKTKVEINNIIKAQRISEKVLTEAVNKLKVDLTEVNLAKFIVGRMKYYQIKSLAFEPIVAFGKNTANIHHVPGRTKLKLGNLVMLDFGATVKSYCSDMTRTYIFGQPTAKQKEVYQTVLKAQELSLAVLKKGLRQADKIDSQARRFIVKRFGANSFNHGLGHGLGTVIHEWPSLKPGSLDILKYGMVITLEPGIYLPGWGGVRIEDMVLIGKNGTVNLTQAAKDLTKIILKI